MTVDHRSLRDGRVVAVHRVGDPSGRAVVLCHPAPGSGDFDPDPEATSARGARILSIDRPGYGGSEAVSGDAWASVSGAADDLAEVLRDLGAGPVGVAGWSAGGRVAMALAVRHPSLVTRLCVIATPAPNDEVAWIPPEFQAAIEGLGGLPPAEVHAALAAQLRPMIPDDPTAAAALGLLGAGQADHASAFDRPGGRERIGRMLEVAFAQGAVGLAADIAGYTMRPWGFDPAAVTAKTLLLYGAKDPLGGSRHGRWWQRHLPDARLEVNPEAGHLVVMPMWGRVLSFLLAVPSR